MARVGPLAVLALLVGCSGQDPADPSAGGGDTAVEVGPAEAMLPDDFLWVVGDAWTAEASVGPGQAAAWDFGDGTTGDGAAVSHTWTEPGRYRVVLRVDGAPPAQDDCVVTVVNPPLDEPPVASGRLRAFGDGLVVALPDFDQIAFVSGGVEEPQVRRVDACDRPVSLSVEGDTVAVACRDEARVVDEMGAVLESRAGDAAAVLLRDGVLEVLWRDGRLDDEDALQGRVLVGWGEERATVAFLSPADHGLWWDGETHELSRDEGPDSDGNARGVPNLMQAGAMRPDGGLLVWGGLKANTERGLFNEGSEFGHDTVMRSVLKTVDPSGAEQVQPLLDNRDLVGAVAFTPMGDRLLVAHQGAHIVDILDAYTMQRTGGWQDVGLGLDGLWTDGEVAWVLASLDRELVAFDLTAGNAQVELARVLLVDDEVLDADVLLGKRIFHDAGAEALSHEAYVSCASCHPDGGEDGRVWDFTQRGEGLRNTLAIWSMPPDGPFHWSANFDELQDFENDIRLHQSGLGYLSEADWAEAMEPLGPAKAGRSAELDALAAYMRFVAAEGPPAPPPDAPARDDGALAEAGCTSCHTGDLGTDAGWSGDAPVLHDVGTLTPASGQRLGGELPGLRTPSLNGLAWTAPYLHDGSAGMLEEAVAAHAPVADEALRARVMAALEAR